ncbi:MAG: hypothetical protein U9Q63_04250, partial [Patescibacteria group bacterium]|nr:hypothetical protein [Patescibacteria group bacterium]
MAENIGGGERYLLTVAECLLPHHQVDLILQSQFKFSKQKLLSIKKKFSKSFNLNLANLNIILGPFGSNTSSKKRKLFTKQYDIFYYMSDGSLFLSKAKYNAVHFMIPFNSPLPLIQKLKLKTWQVKTANSFFTKNHIEKIWKIKVDHVHLGAVDPKDFNPTNKKKIILNVGRFFSPTGNKHCKRQDFLVKTFIKLLNEGLNNWQLILNGPIDKGRDNIAYAKEVA